MNYEIQDHNCELLRAELNESEAVITEVRKPVYTRGRVEWNVVLPGRGLAGQGRLPGTAKSPLS